MIGTGHALVRHRPGPLAGLPLTLPPIYLTATDDFAVASVHLSRYAAADTLFETALPPSCPMAAGAT